MPKYHIYPNIHAGADSQPMEIEAHNMAPADGFMVFLDFSGKPVIALNKDQVGRVDVVQE